MRCRVIRTGLLIALIAASAGLRAATPLTTISYTTPDSTYTQNFDALVSANTMNDANSTLSPSGPDNVQDLVAAPISAPASLNGWSIANVSTPSRPRFLIEDGSRSILPGGNYGFYVGGTGLNPDMALGTCPFSGGNMVADTFPRMGAIFVNNTGVTLNSFVIVYRLEQWCVGGTHTVPFEYSVGATDINTVGSGTPFAPITALDLVSFVGGFGAVNGDAPGNFMSRSALVGVAWTPGAQLVIRWTDLNGGNSINDKLAVDDFQFTASQGGTTFYATGMSPAPGSIQTSAVSSAVLTFRSNLSTASVNANTITLQSGGADGILGTADDVFLVPSISVVNGNQIQVNLPAQGQVSQQYRITALASASAAPNSTAFVQDANGDNLDGEFNGAFPSGDGSPGGAFSATFEVDLLQTMLATAAMPATIAYGTAGAVTLTATASASQSINTGTITFQLQQGGVNFGSPVTSATVVNGVGSANISIPAGSSAGNYTVVATYSGGSQFFGSSDNSAQIAVTPAALSIVANNATRVYGTADPPFSGTITGLKNGDAISATYAASEAATSPIGQYSIAPTLVDPGGKLSNYTLTAVNGVLSITTAPLTVSPANASRSYGTANPAFTGTLSGVQAGDAITATYTTAATPASPIGPYAIVPLLADPGNRLSNYAVTQNDGTLTVSPAFLIVLAANAERQYGVDNPVFSGTLFGVANGDNILALYNSTATASSPVGQYPITPSLLDPDNRLGNYAVNSYNGILTISKAALSVTVTHVTRPYGSDNPELVGTIAGIQNNDNISATYATVATRASSIGNYAIIPTLVDPDGDLANYAVTVPNGTLTVGKATLIVTPANASKTYGYPNPPLTVTIAGVQNDDGITASVSTLATNGSPAGSYAISASLSDPGGALPNYNVTLNTGTLTVDPATLTVSTNNASRIYGAADPVYAGTISGVVNGDNLTATYFAGTTAASPAGTYPIAAVFTDPDGKLGNYTLIANYGSLTIQKATPGIAWAQPARILAGVPLSDAQLNAAASDPTSGAELSGSYVYAPAAGAVLAPGSGQSLSVTFTPEDTLDYSSASASVTIEVDAAIPVAITSATTASGQTGTSFTYTITATGSAPMTYMAAGLPAGLNLNVDAISGMPTVSGVFDVVLTVSNYANTATQPLKIVVTKSTGVNHSPVFTSPPMASANPATTGVAVTLTASATDADGDALDYAWDFGDGITGLGASVSKTYSAAGVYVVNVVVSDGQASDTQSINLVVENAPPVGNFAVQKVSVEFNFVKSGSDSLTLSGTIPLPTGFNPSGKSARVLIGGLDNTYTLTAKGESSDKSFALKGKLTGGSATFACALTKKNLFTPLEELGFSKTQSNPSLILPVVVVLDGTSYLDQPVIKYAAKGNKKGPVSGLGKK